MELSGAGYPPPSLTTATTALDMDNGEKHDKPKARTSTNRRINSLHRHLTAATESPLLSSVVKIFTTSVSTNYASPWQRQREKKSTGTGFAINLKDIIPYNLPTGVPSIVLLTNNHVISNATTVRVLRHGKPGKYIGRILCAAPECDLAIVAVEDIDFWRSIKPLKFAFNLHNSDNGEILPELGLGVTAVGYPMGGENISVTRGVVSRIDLMDYTSVNPVGKLPVVQIDAAINPGNSGGPVINAKQECVGVAFAGITRGNSIGYIIPLPVLRMFVLNSETYMKQLKVHGQDPFPRLASLGLGLQSTESPPLRRRYQLTGGSATESSGGSTMSVDHRLGMLVVRVSASSPCAKFVEQGDIVTSIAGHQVSEDGTVEVRTGSRVSLLYSVCMRRPGESFELKLWRNGASCSVTIIASPVPRLVPRLHGVDAFPSYLVVGGLVFVPLSLPWIRSAQGAMGQGAVAALLTHAEQDLERRGQQVIVLSTVLSHDVNFGYESFAGEVLVEFQSKTVENLQQLSEMVLLKESGKEKEGKLYSFSFESKRQILLDQNACLQAEKEILDRHSIPTPLML